MPVYIGANLRQRMVAGGLTTIDDLKAFWHLRLTALLERKFVKPLIEHKSPKALL
jgi:hypothetical protein